MSIIQLTQTVHIAPARQAKQPKQPMLPGMEPEQSAPQIVTNRQIAEVLSSIANVLEFQNSNPYRIQAYRNAARGVLDLPEPAANDLCIQALPAQVRALMGIEHVGPHTAVRLYEELGVDTPEKLWRAAQQQRIRQLSGFGMRSEARLKDAAARVLRGKKPATLGDVA